MGIQNYCTCSKDYGEKNFTLQPTNEAKNSIESQTPKSNLKIYDNLYNNINLINSNYFSINPTHHNNDPRKFWKNCVPQKGSAEVFFGRTSEISSFSNSIYTVNNNNLNSNNIHENNILNLPYGDKYEGEINNNKPNGKGIYYSIMGEIKEGNFVDGRLNGHGKMTLNNGFFIEGNFVDDELDGYGKTLNINGEMYEGEFKNGIREGKGKLILSNEDRFEGNFIKGKLEGNGKFIAKNGEIYEGEFVNGIPDGKGIKKFKDGSEYVGNFRNGKENGYGVKKLKNGEIYEGEFLNGLKHGRGKHIFEDGQQYEGDFYEDHYNGNGIYLWPDGLKYKGEFKDDKVEGKGILTWPNGDRYEGDFIDGKYNGFGKEIKIDGSKYEGYFKDDDYEGQGIKIFQNGEKYEGEFYKGNMHGKGKWYFLDGSTLEGTWNFGNKDGIFKKKSKDGKYYIIKYKDNNVIKEDLIDNVSTKNDDEKNYNGIIKVEINEHENQNGGNIFKRDSDEIIQNKNYKLSNTESDNKKNNEESKDNNLIDFNEKNFNEFTFILLTNFEAKKLTVNKAKEKIILPINEIDKLSTEEFLNKIKDNMSLYLNCKNEESLSNIFNWLLYLYNANNNDKNIMQNEFLTILSNIKEYPKDQELFLSKKVKKYLYPKKDEILEKLNLYKYNNNYVSFFLLKKIIEEEKIELKEQYFVYLFYALKLFDDPEASLNDLKFELLLDILNDSNNDSKMDEESDLEISDEEYNQIILDFQTKLLHYINSNHTNLRFILNGLIKVTNLGDENNVIEVVLIRPFFERMKEIGIWMNNELEIYCIFNRYKLSEKFEGINIYLLEEELKNLKVNNSKLKSLSNLNEKIIMENIKEENEENEENSFDS